MTSTVPTCISALTFRTGDETLQTTRSVYRLTADERLKKKKDDDNDDETVRDQRDRIKKLEQQLPDYFRAF